MPRFLAPSLLAAAIALAFAPVASAQQVLQPADTSACVGLENDAQRLQCYDTAAGRVQQGP